jgi:predicted nuclease of predicted toxin-antitoxin system
VKLLLDEMFSPAIAVQLRARGLDVVAISEPTQSSRYGGVPDDRVLAHAQEDDRAIVTDNVGDYEHARLEWETRGEPHQGVIYAPFNRHRGEAVIGQMVKALAAFLAAPEATREPLNRAHYLRSADT